MKNKKEISFKKWYKMAKTLALTGFIFWFTETIYFIWLEGWHLRATSIEERWADSIVSFIFTACIYCLLMCLVHLIEWRISISEELGKMVDGMNWDKKKTENGHPLEGLKDEDLEPVKYCPEYHPLNIVCDWDECKDGRCENQEMKANFNTETPSHRNTKKPTQ